MKTVTFLLSACLVAALFSTSCTNNSSTATGGTDTLAQNKAIASKVSVAFFTDDSAALDSAISPDMIDHQLPPNRTGTTMQKVNSGMRMFKAAFPDEKFEVKAITAEGNLVSVFGTFSGTNSGSFMGMPSTNKMISMDGADIFRIENGKIDEHWGVLDIIPVMMGADAAKMMKKDKTK